MTRTVLISGASIAGPALAFWLHRHGFRPVVVERAPAIRAGGYPIDVRAGAVEVVQRMGLLPAVREAHVDTQRGRFVDARGRVIARITPDEFTGSPEGRDVELPRGDLARLLHQRTRDDVEYLFDDTITGLDQRENGVHVTFGKASPRTVDLVIGADGLHSTVRALAFGPESDYRHDLGFAFAGFSLDPAAVAGRKLEQEFVAHNTPGRMAAVYAVRGQQRLTGMLAFSTPPGFAVDPRDLAGQRDVVAAAFRAGGWEVPGLVAAMRTAEDFFFDTVSQIRMPRWSTGRVALVGDAAHAPALLSGQGTSLALIGAYVLAGELAAAEGDPAAAFAAYERALRPFVERNQQLATSGGATLIPRTRTALWLRNRVLAVLPHLGPAKRLFTGRVDEAARSFPLPDYPSPVADVA
ncbi:2-polyprenyl-6-methoxyphenol hydroxylase-like FAD-dependent oxidoreductase [Pseudonocardia hierapolitana]|uniref:2-polyprenyl-6-methoxyphenol hydroxylase-like FAD-dependent oxidoreductase n=1 Tax=Pseudonocardia hierapolitana TaxID=1128676 RepID=A0A561SHC6_9PSEU|nr:FAD-dependent monooxygenase [Pseudonocardia hierapolitana]TWF74253.1 2-polyprenyl-6-methoxyphenol hydroxylase-like FAD-dependent oxidoreductase [Pseudonocardia hierapolitana]